LLFVSEVRSVSSSHSLESASDSSIIFRKQWSEEAMTKALADINSGKCYVRRAAEDYCIPKSTIYDRLSGKVVPGSVCGAHRYLTESKENELEAFLLGCSEIGFGKTRSEVLRIVERVLRQRGVNQSVSNGWWESFLKRHPKLSLTNTNHD
jgi:hypothetical protein